ncbi:hypothetical protein JSCD9_35020 [Clostridioides difficile]|nr:hypothetical protein JSCD9_35020 [Clostridioides difficile]
MSIRERVKSAPKFVSNTCSNPSAFKAATIFPVEIDPGSNPTLHQ